MALLKYWRLFLHTHTKKDGRILVFFVAQWILRWKQREKKNPLSQVQTLVRMNTNIFLLSICQANEKKSNDSKSASLVSKRWVNWSASRECRSEVLWSQTENLKTVKKRQDDWWLLWIEGSLGEVITSEEEQNEVNAAWSWGEVNGLPKLRVPWDDCFIRTSDDLKLKWGFTLRAKEPQITW